MKNTTLIVLFTIILSFSLGINKNLSAQVAEQDSLALVALYNSTDGPNWTHNDNWLEGPVSTWYGVTLYNDRVIRVNLGNNNLIGILPPEIGNLTRLQTLGLSENRLMGDIPPEIGNLISLRSLFLGLNQLLGSIPAEIGEVAGLQRMNLSKNRLFGAIPKEIGNLTLLTNLYLSYNQLSGSLPPEICGLIHLEYLSLSHNELADSLPHEIGGLVRLKEMHLDSNQFVGAVPGEIDSLKNLQRLYLADNQFIDLPDLSPDTSLVRLVIQNNRFTFEDIEPNIWVETFYYSPQDSVGEARDTTVAAGEPLELSVSVGGAANQYQWMKDGVNIPDADSSVYVIPAAAATDSGRYVCKITNSIATELTLYSRLIHVVVSGGTGVAENLAAAPEKFALHQNYPNPFNPTTTIAFNVARPSHVRITVFDRLGRQVAVLVNQRYERGSYQAVFDASQLASGVYFYRIRTGEFEQTHKMVLVR